MVNFKACLRCKGDVQSMEDRWGGYLHCLQCGNAINLEPDPNKTRILPELMGPQKPGRPRKKRANRDVA